MIDATAAADGGVKRYVPPPPRNRSINRRKSGDRFDKPNHSHGIDGEKNQPSNQRIVAAVEHGEFGGNRSQNENIHSGLIPLDGCSNSEAAQLLSERFAATMRLLEEPSIDTADKPVVYSGASGSSWVHIRLPHQMDFSGQLRRELEKANYSGESTASEEG